MAEATTTTPPLVPPLDDPHWHGPMTSACFVFLDCEMTGVDASHDALVEVALCRVRGGVIEGRFSSLVHCPQRSCEEAMALHGISPDECAAAPSFAAIASTVRCFLEGAIAVMHDPNLDVAFLEAAFDAAGAPFRFGPVLDTVMLARRAVLAPSYALSALAHTLNFTPRRWHRAAEDVAGLQDLFGHLVEALVPASPYDLWQVRAGQKGPVMVRDSIARRLEAAVHSNERLGLVLRARGMEPTLLAARILRWTPPHCVVALGDADRVLRVLRADRILRLDPCPEPTMAAP
ncbi:MAG: 3'-5' exonuclease [Myxococcales bacterium]|nr:3'-5' exonuclease [Myxococcales bacterium]